MKPRYFQCADPENPNQKRINELRRRISDIYLHKTSRHVTNAYDAIPMMKEQIRLLGGNPHVYSPPMG